MADVEKLSEGKRLIAEGGGFVVSPFIAEDVQCWNEHLTLEQCSDFLDRHESHLIDLAIERVNEGIETMLLMDGLAPDDEDSQGDL